MLSSDELLELLLARLDDELPSAQRLRQRIHANPELAHHEHSTAAAIAQRLELQTEPAGTGLVACTGGGGKAVAVRAELDGLPIEERTQAQFASVNGAMHACGHDVHAAALVALLRAARTLEQQLPAPLMAVFQPSEEAYPSGAKMLVDEGHLDRRVRAILAVHVHPDLPWGVISVGQGPINAACDNLAITVEGRAAHGAYPHLGRDPILAISSIVMGLNTLVSRRLDPLHSAVLTVGELHSGTAENVIPAQATATLTLRTYEDADRRALRALIEQLVTSTAQAYGCSARIEMTEGEPVLENDGRISQCAAKLAAAAGFRLADPPRSCGSDDFSFFGVVAPIAMCFAGLSGAPGFEPQPLHHPRFLPPDDAVVSVARAQAVLYAAAAYL
jgi:amidohydrolase